MYQTINSHRDIALLHLSQYHTNINSEDRHKKQYPNTKIIIILQTQSFLDNLLQKNPLYTTTKQKKGG